MVDYKIYKYQRIGVFVDVQNFYYSAKQLFNCKVNFGQILRDSIKDRTLVRALAYVIKAEVGAEQQFFDALDQMGYEVRSKDIQVFVGGAKKGDWDVGITMDCIGLAPKLDVVVLCSGDGDFIPLVEYLQTSAGCRVEVMAFGKCTSQKLKEQADAFFDLSNKKYLISYPKRPEPQQPDRPMQEPLPAPKEETVAKQEGPAPPNLLKEFKIPELKPTTKRKPIGDRPAKTKTR